MSRTSANSQFEILELDAPGRSLSAEQLCLLSEHLLHLERVCAIIASALVAGEPSRTALDSAAGLLEEAAEIAAGMRIGLEGRRDLEEEPDV